MQPLAEVPDLRRITGASWPDELAAQTLLAAASAAVRAYCGWPITAQTNAVAVLDSDGGRVVMLPSLHVTAVHSVVDAEGTPVTDYTWSATGVLYRRPCWPYGLRALTVTYDDGYPDPPQELTAVVCGLAGRQSIPAGVAGMTVGSQTITFTGEAGPGLSSVDELILERYRIPAGG